VTDPASAAPPPAVTARARAPRSPGGLHAAGGARGRCEPGLRGRPSHGPGFVWP